MIQKIGVVGAGTMGAGITQLCLQQGFYVVLHDASREALDAAAERVRQGLDAAVSKGRISVASSEAALKKIVYAKGLDDLRDADIVIEAASENLEIKRRIFGELSALCPGAILATNTSSLPVAAATQAAVNPERVLGMHFFNPPVAMKLVEMVRTPKTGDAAYQAAWDFARSGLGRVPVAVKDTPGFIVNRVMRPYYLECQKAALAGSGIAPLDAAAKAIGGAPLGPFELMDLIGLDVNLSITKVIYEACGRPERFKPAALQETLVAQGAWGRKAGRGFYRYENGKAAGENPEALALLPKTGDLSAAAAWERVIGSVISEAGLAAQEGVAGKADIDVAIKLAMNFPRGPFEWLEKNAGE
ncbi:MAG: 3-hydroxyacyl-CoA dehydrogenase [Elusimicrobiota bacterium]